MSSPFKHPDLAPGQDLEDVVGEDAVGADAVDEECAPDGRAQGEEPDRR